MTIIAIMFDGNETARNRMTTHINTDSDLDAGIAALIAADPRWSAIVARTGRPPLRRREGGFAGLAQIIVSQQVSVASAAAIHGRLVAIADPFDHTSILRARKDRLLRVGLSNAKIKTLKAIAKAIDSGAIDLNALADMPADAAHATLVALHGIGPWTADVYLLACIGHADAWPAGDIALQEAARVAFDLPKRPTTREMGPLADLWRPYRAVAARLLWSYYRVIKQREGLLIQPKSPTDAAPADAAPAERKKPAQSSRRTKPAAPKKKRATRSV